MNTLITDELQSTLDDFPRNKVEIITKYLREKISNRNLQPDDIRLNARTLTETYNISRVTAHRILSELSPALVPAEKTTLRIGICISDLINLENTFSYNKDIFRYYEQGSAFDQALRMGAEPVMVSLEQMNSGEWKTLNLDGLVVRHDLTAKATRELRQSNIPVVLDAYWGAVPCLFNAVAIDISEAMFELFELWDDSEDILLCGCADRRSTTRLGTVRWCLEDVERDLTRWHTRILPSTRGDLGQLAGYKLGLELVADKKYRRILTINDFFAFGLITAFDEAKWRPGQDYELIGMDNLEGMGQNPFGEPFVSSFDLSLDQFSVECMKLVVSLAKNPREGNQKVTIRMPSRLIQRKTTRVI